MSEAQQTGPASAYNNFIALNRDLLDCYASNGLNPNAYKQLTMGEQRDVCYAERVRIEDRLMKHRISAGDFIRAAKHDAK